MSFNPNQRLASWLLLASLIFVSCGVVGPKRTIEVLATNGQVKSIDLTQRHYRAESNCREALTIAVPSLLRSLQPLTDEQRRKLTWTMSLAKYRPSDCASFSSRGQIVSELTDIYGVKSRRIGIILPPVSTAEPAIQLLLGQINFELRRQGFDPNEAIIVKRAEKTFQSAKKAASELTHLDRVSILVGGLHPSHSDAIVEISDEAQIPSLILSANAQLGKTVQSMRVYPPVKRLASLLSSTLKSNGISNAIAFYPTTANLEIFRIMKSNSQSGINYTEATYSSDDSQSVLNAVKNQISRISMDRSQTAILIFDNFRMVRHITNIVSTSLPDRKILVAGHQQWRSRALVSPKEDALQGALFADFIGSYRNLPDTIDVPEGDNQYFTTAQAASRIDYQILGHRIGNIAAEATRFGISRYVFAQRIQLTKNKWDTYFPRSELAFDSQRDSSWPVFLFQVDGESIKEL